MSDMRVTSWSGPLLRGALPRSSRRVAHALLAATAAAFLIPATGVAGTYEVVACDVAPGGVNAAWHAQEDPGTMAVTSCPTAGDERRGLVVRNRVGEGVVPRGDGASLTFAAPHGAALERITYDWDGRQADSDWSVGLIGEAGADLLAGCPARPGEGGRCRLGSAGGLEETARYLYGRREVSLVATCRARGGCETDALGSSTDRTRARLATHSATVEVADYSVPELTAAGGDLLNEGWLRGNVEGTFHAEDNVGDEVTSLHVDGIRRQLDPHDCDYTRRVPCPRAATPAYSLDTRALSDGQHEVAVEAVDTAGNPNRLSRTVRVDNQAPGPVRDLRVVGGEETRAENSFDVRWTAPGGQVAPITRARYRLCRIEAATSCVTGARDGSDAGIDGLSVPERGDWALEVWLEDAAGNADPSSAPDPVTLSFDDRAPTLLSASIAAGDGEPSSHLKIDYGGSATVTGTLSDLGGDRLDGVPIAVLARVRGEEPFERVASIATEEDGGFAYRVPTGPSRTLRFEYGGSDRHRPASAELTLSVRAASSISVSDHHVRNGDRVLFEGRLRGTPYPSDGKLVELQAFYRDRWRTFAVTRATAAGGWSYRYRFGATRGRVTYPFRARIPRERSYPYALGHSRTVRVTVRGG